MFAAICCSSLCFSLLNLDQIFSPSLTARISGTLLLLRDTSTVSSLFQPALFADSRIVASNARIAGMTKDLNLNKTKDRYQWLLTIFYISYILFEFQALMWKTVPPNKWAAFVVFGWGIVATLQAATHNWESEMVCRWFLGKFMPLRISPLVPLVVTVGRTFRGRFRSRHTLPPFVFLPSARARSPDWHLPSSCTARYNLCRCPCLRHNVGTFPSAELAFAVPGRRLAHDPHGCCRLFLLACLPRQSAVLDPGRSFGCQSARSAPSGPR